MRSIWGTDAISAWVYGCPGLLKIGRTSPRSTTRPAYITATVSHILATMPKSWVMKMIAIPVSSWISLRRRRYWSWMVASRAVVGSSAMITLGALEMAMAPSTRCFMPPLIWWGKSRIRCSGAATRTLRRASTARSHRFRFRPPSWVPNASTTWLPTVNTGFSEVWGSWKIMAIFLPRTCRISSSDSLVRSSPSSSTSPETIRAAGLGMMRSRERAVMVLPQPDSPTMPRVSPSRNWKLTPSTALVTPRRLKK